MKRSITLLATLALLCFSCEYFDPGLDIYSKKDKDKDKDDPAAGVYGAEANTTGDPIGGGEGYRAIEQTGDYRVADAATLLQVLQKAQAGEVIYIEPGTEIDLTGRTNLSVPANVTLAGNRGENGSPGPLLFTTNMPDRSVLFKLREGARMTGLRIQGPDPDYDAYQFQVNSANRTKTRCMITTGANIEVDNCEISNFDRGGIEFQAGTRDLHVHHNFLHDIGQNPLAALKEAGTPVLIEANIIEWVRFALAGTGFPGSGFEARYNKIVRKPVPAVWQPYDGSPAISISNYSDIKREQGIRLSGEQFSIHHNTFMSEAPGDGSVGLSGDAAFYGIPQILAELYNNRFMAEEANQAVLHESGNIWVHNNMYGVGEKMIEYANESSSQILFQVPAPPGLAVPVISGDRLDVDVQINLAPGSNGIRMVEVDVDQETVYSGPEAPLPGQISIVLSSLRASLDHHELVVRVTDDRDITSQNKTVFAMPE